MTGWIGEAFVSDTGWNHLERLVDIGNRMAGSEGERRAAEATKRALADIGARNPEVEPFPIQGWWRGDAELVAGDQVAEGIALPRSPAATGSGALIDGGYGLPEEFDRDLEGNVILVRSDVPSWYERYIHRIEKYCRAVDSGAAGFIYANHVEGCLPPTGSIGSTDHEIGAIPAVGVSKEVGATLRRRHVGDPVRVTVDAEIDDARSQNVHADLGPSTTAAVLLTAHVDAHDISEGAVDNGAGTAMVVQVAEALRARESTLDTRVHCLVFGAEEVGLCGSHMDAEYRSADEIVAIVNLDGVCRGRTLSVKTLGFPELTAAATRVADRLDQPIETSPRISTHSDQWPYGQRGIPACQVASETASRGRGWGHTAADTLDKIEPRIFREQAVLVAELVFELATTPDRPTPRDPDDMAAQLEREGEAESLRQINRWPFGG